MASNIIAFREELDASWRQRAKFVVPTFCVAFASATLDDYIAFVKRERVGDDAYLFHTIDRVWKCIAGGTRMYNELTTMEKLVELAPDYDEFGDDMALTACQFAHHAVASLLPDTGSTPGLNLVSRLHAGAASEMRRDGLDYEDLQAAWNTSSVQAVVNGLRQFVESVLLLNPTDVLAMRDSLATRAQVIVRLSSAAERR